MTAELLPVAREAVALLGEQIAARRREIGMTAAELAERAGVTRVTISKVESAHAGVAIGTVFSAAAIVGVPLFGEQSARGVSDAGEALRTYRRLLPDRVRVKAIDDDF